MKNPFLIGNQIYLRAIEAADAELLTSYINDQDVIRTLNRFRPANQGQQEDFIRTANEDKSCIFLGIVTKEEDHLIGTLGLHGMEYKDRCGTFGIYIGDKDQWGKGYGGEATRMILDYGFGTLNLNRIELTVYENNERGIRAYERAGFKIEGRFRKKKYREGRHLDMILMGILKEEWAPTLK